MNHATTIYITKSSLFAFLYHRIKEAIDYHRVMGLRDYGVRNGISEDEITHMILVISSDDFLRHVASYVHSHADEFIETCDAMDDGGYVIEITKLLVAFSPPLRRTKSSYYTSWEEFVLDLFLTYYNTIGGQ